MLCTDSVSPETRCERSFLRRGLARRGPSSWGRWSCPPCGETCRCRTSGSPRPTCKSRCESDPAADQRRARSSSTPIWRRPSPAFREFDRQHVKSEQSKKKKKNSQTGVKMFKYQDKLRQLISDMSNGGIDGLVQGEIGGGEGKGGRWGR